MKFKMKSWEELEAEGFKWSWDRLYIGEKRNPEVSVHPSFKDLYMGQEVEVINVDPDANNNQVSFVGRSGRTVSCSYLLFEKSAQLIKLSKKPKKLKLKDKEAKFFKSIGFNFPCAWSELSEKDAIKVASWILRVTK
jgi:hypothetical protein